MLSTARARILFVTCFPGGRAVTCIFHCLDSYVTHYVRKNSLISRFGKTRHYTRSYSTALFHVSNPGVLKRGVVRIVDYLSTFFVQRQLGFSAR